MWRSAWVLLLLLVCHASRALRCPSSASLACTLCLQLDQHCAALYRLEGCAGVTQTLALATASNGSDPRRHYFPATWLGVVSSLDDAVCALRSSDMIAPSASAFAVLDVLQRTRTFLTSAGLGCSDTNERYVLDPNTGQYACTCMPGHVCDADDGGASADNTSNILLYVVLGVLLLAIVLEVGLGFWQARAHHAVPTPSEHEMQTLLRMTGALVALEQDE